MTFSSRKAAGLGLRRAAGLGLAIALWCGTCGMTEALADPTPEPPPPPPAPSLTDPGSQPPPPPPAPNPADPGTEPPPPPPAPSHPIIDAGAIDSLLVSFDDVKALSGGGYLDYAVSQQPTTVASADPGGECALALSDEGASAVFGTNWTAFRDANTTGSNIYLRQAIGIYPDPGAAQAVFDNLVSGLKTCTFNRTGSIGIASLTGNSAAWLIPGNRTCAEEARVVKNVFFRVGSCRQTPAAPVVRVANQISGRISAA